MKKQLSNTNEIKSHHNHSYGVHDLCEHAHSVEQLGSEIKGWCPSDCITEKRNCKQSQQTGYKQHGD